LSHQQWSLCRIAWPRSPQSDFLFGSKIIRKRLECIKNSCYLIINDQHDSQKIRVQWNFVLVQCLEESFQVVFGVGNLFLDCFESLQIWVYRLFDSHNNFCNNFS
jgi:hypothetical protein